MQLITTSQGMQLLTTSQGTISAILVKQTRFVHMQDAAREIITQHLPVSASNVKEQRRTTFL